MSSKQNRHNHRTSDNDNVFDRQASSTDHDEIAHLAYSNWEEGGCREGQELANWLDAERTVQARQNEPRAMT